MTQLLPNCSPVDERPAVVAGVFALCVATTVAYAGLRISYTGDVISAETHTLASTVVLYSSVLGGAAITGVLSYWHTSAPTSVLLGLVPPAGVCLGSLGTVAIGIGYYDSSPAILLTGFLLFSSVVNGVAWVIGASVLHTLGASGEPGETGEENVKK